jgi:starch synthase
LHQIGFTIHNLANQGIAKPGIIKYAQIDKNIPAVKTDLKDGFLNLMAQGIMGADWINTVSPTYAREILTSFQGMGLEKILFKRKRKLSGILNGIDTEFFDPEKDAMIYKTFGKKGLKYKQSNKIRLQKNLKLGSDKKTALIGVVSRLVWQKGFDLITEGMVDPEKNRNLPRRFIFLGEGDKVIEKNLADLEKKYPKNVRVLIKFDEKLAHKIYASSDIFLMPSLFEPCGLGQLIAMRYGTLPLVHETGGFSDTVGPDTGFSFKKYSSNTFSETLDKALQTYYEKPEKWKKMQTRCMKKDFSWNKSGKSYLALYRSILKHR